MTAIHPMLTRTCRPRALTTALALAAFTTLTGPAHAADECGALDPTTEDGRTIECTEDNYTPDPDDNRNGVDNIFYEIGDWTNPADGDYSFTIHGDLIIRGRRSNKGQAREGGVGHGPERRRGDYPITDERNTVVIPANEGDAVYYGDGPVGDDGDGLEDEDGDGVSDNMEGPQDDHGRRHYTPGNPPVLTNPDTPVVGTPPNTRYAGIYIDTHQDFDGDITLRSEATIEVDNEPFSTNDAALRKGRREGISADGSATGISVLHHGRSGSLDLTIGGAITSPGEGVRAEIDPLADSVQDSTFKDLQFMGSIGIRLLPGVTITTSREDGDGIQAWHRGTGDVTLTAAIPVRSDTPNIATAGHDASGISAEAAGYHNMDAGDVTKGDIAIDLTNIFIRTTGGFGTDSGRDFGPPRDRSWEGSRGFKLYSFNQGNIDLDLTGSRVETRGVRGQGIYAVHFADGANPEGDITIDLATTAITTAGNYADGILAYHGSKGLVDIDLRRGSTVATTGTDAHAIAGLHHGTGDVDIALTGSTITTSGAGADGLRGGHRGAGDVRITLTDSTVTTTGAEADGIFAFHLGAVTVTRESGDGMGDLTRHAQHTPPPVAVYADSGPWGLFAETGATPGSDDPPPTLTVAVKSSQITVAQGQDADAHAVKFEGAKGILTLTDSTLIGGIRFATGTYDDTLDVMGQGGVDGPIAFDAGTDTLTLDIARGQHFIFDGAITGLETLTLTGGGLARFAAPVNLVAPGTATVTDGTLVLASGLTSRTVTISAKGRLVLEAGLDSSDQLTYGQIASGTVHFAGDPVVFAQLAPDLTADQIRTVREQLAAASLTRADLLPTTLTQGDDNTDLTMGTIVIRSTQADGTVVDVGTIAADGTITLDANRIAQLVLPEPVPAPPRPATLGPRHRLVAALPAVLLDMTALEAPSAGPGTWARLLGSTADRTRKDATVPTAYDLVRRGVALGHGLELGPGRTLGLAVQHQTGSATVTNGGTIDVTATTLGVRHAWALEATTLGLAASATTLASDLAVTGTGRLAAGLSGTGLTAGLRADHRLALPDDATVTLGADLTHARVKADAFTTEAATKEQATAIKGSATTLALTADWTTPRPTGAVFAGARLALPLGGTAQARVGTTALTSKPRPALGVQGGIAFGGTAITLGYGRESGGDSLAASLTHRF